MRIISFFFFSRNQYFVNGIFSRKYFKFFLIKYRSKFIINFTFFFIATKIQFIHIYIFFSNALRKCYRVSIGNIKFKKNELLKYIFMFSFLSEKITYFCN